jgi:D-arabinose 1-dehydrogenase-like Zn-dependent alcohol dehydrogenase
MPTFSMLFRRLRVAGSLIGGIKETQEMLDYCAEKVGRVLGVGNFIVMRVQCNMSWTTWFLLLVSSR